MQEISKSWCQIAESAQIIVAADLDSEQQVPRKTPQKDAQVSSHSPVLEKEGPDSARLKVLSFSSEGSEVRESSSSDCDLLPGVTSPGTVDLVANNEQIEDSKRVQPNTAQFPGADSSSWPLNKSEPAASTNLHVDKLLQDNSELLQDNSESLQDNSESLQDIMKRYLPLSRPHTTTSKSFDQKKPSHLNYEKLLPLRHSLDKPQPLPLSSVSDFKTSQSLTTSVSDSPTLLDKLSVSTSANFSRKSNFDQQNTTGTLLSETQSYVPSFYKDIQPKRKIIRGNLQVDDIGHRRQKRFVDKPVDGKSLTVTSHRVGNSATILSDRSLEGDNPTKTVSPRHSGADNSSQVMLDTSPTKLLSDSSSGLDNPLFSENNSCQGSDMSENKITEMPEINPAKEVSTTNLSNIEGTPSGTNKPTQLSVLPLKPPSSPSNPSDLMSQDPSGTPHKDLSISPPTSSSPADTDNNFKNSDPTTLQNKTSQLTHTVSLNSKPVKYRPLVRDVYSELSADISLDSLVCEKVGLKVETNNKTKENYNSSIPLSDDVMCETKRNRHRTSSPKSEARKSDTFNHFRVVSPSQPKLDQPGVRSSQQQKFDQLVSLPEPKRSDKYNHFTIVSSSQPLKSNRSTSNKNYQSFFLHLPDDNNGNLDLREPEVGRFSLNTMDSLDGLVANGGTALHLVSSNNSVMGSEFNRKFIELNVHQSQDDTTPRDSLEFDITPSPQLSLKFDNNTSQKQPLKFNNDTSPRQSLKLDNNTSLTQPRAAVLDADSTKLNCMRVEPSPVLVKLGGLAGIRQGPDTHSVPSSHSGDTHISAPTRSQASPLVDVLKLDTHETPHRKHNSHHSDIQRLDINSPRQYKTPLTERQKLDQCNNSPRLNGASGFHKPDLQRPVGDRKSVSLHSKDEKNILDVQRPLESPQYNMRLSLEANALLMQKGKLRAVQTRETAPLLGAVREEGQMPSVANILKKVG